MRAAVGLFPLLLAFPAFGGRETRRSALLLDGASSGAGGHKSSRRGTRGGVGGQESGGGLHLVRTVKTGLFLHEVGVNPQEGRRRVHGGDDAEGVGELVAEPAQRVDDEVEVGDRVADVSECVGEAFEAAAVVVHGEVALHQVVEVLQGVHRALRRVVEEETADGSPGGEGRSSAVKHHVTDGFGDRKINPGDDAVVDLRPLDVEQARLRVDGAVDMVQ
jgi:hypothetical protein